jgi:2-polyprenyl-3-methyl-5-hydroxy-6-metoxy-1,4-benzoquinol methylase
MTMLDQQSRPQDDAIHRGTRTAAVERQFRDAAVYLRDNVNVRLRIDIVRAFLKDRDLRSIADIGCGDGSISLSVLPAAGRLLLVDGSAAMLDAARENVARCGAADVRLELADVEAWNTDERFDTVLCLGVLAHLRQPEPFLRKLASLVAEGGVLVLQNSVAGHPYTWIGYCYRAATMLAGRAGYQYTAVSERLIRTTLHAHGFRLGRVFRYVNTFFLLNRLFSPEGGYRLRRRLFGDADRNTLRFLGNDALYLFERETGG